MEYKKNSDKREKRECPICHKIFTILKSSKQKFCSVNCVNARSRKPFRSGVCRQCGKKFTISSRRSGVLKYCSLKCVYDSQRGKPNLKNTGRNIGIKSSQYKHKYCFCCGKEVFYSRTQGKRSKYCGDCHTKGIGKQTGRKPSPRVCRGCGKLFVRQKGSRRKCCDECVKTKNFPRGGTLKGSRKIGGKTVLKTFNCINCGKEVTIRHAIGVNKKYCSRKCQREYTVKKWEKIFKETGISLSQSRKRKDPRFKAWQKAVFNRDKHTCQDCGEKGIELHAHHIKEVQYFLLEAFCVDNGITLCRVCHEKRHSGKASNYALSKRGLLFA